MGILRILHNNINLLRLHYSLRAFFVIAKESAMQIISSDKTRSKTVQGLKGFNSQSLAMQAKKENNYFL